MLRRVCYAPSDAVTGTRSWCRVPRAPASTGVVSSSLPPRTRALRHGRCKGAVDQEIILKKVTTRKLVVDRETVKTLLTGVPVGRLRDVQGGSAAPENAPDDAEDSRMWGACSEPCHPSVKPI